MSSIIVNLPSASLSNQVFAVAGVKEGISPGLKSVWLSVADIPTTDASLALEVAEFPISNAELLSKAKLEQFKTPQTWLDEDHAGLY